MTLPTYEQAMGTSREGAPFSNGTEGECWMGQHCYRCVNDKPAREGREQDGCVLILVALDQRTPAEWIEDQPFSLYHRYRCLYFRDEDDGGGGSEPEPIPDPPGQLALAPREPLERPARMFAPTAQDVRPVTEAVTP
ncbi:hypothetical protein [Actinomadura sp. SCN-SB]|uniref:hypothetical protein n=1 Tax=Actinomadura sp. SCN-SB TaxID=3373092 RepID=UPI0037529F33